MSCYRMPWTLLNANHGATPNFIKKSSKDFSRQAHRVVASCVMYLDTHVENNITFGYFLVDYQIGSCDGSSASV